MDLLTDNDFHLPKHFELILIFAHSCVSIINLLFFWFLKHFSNQTFVQSLVCWADW